MLIPLMRNILLKLDMLPRAESLNKIVQVTHNILNSYRKQIKLKVKKFLDSTDNFYSKLFEIVKLEDITIYGLK